MNTRLANKSELRNHNVDLVRKERHYYQTVLKETSTVIKDLFTVDGSFIPPLSGPIMERNINDQNSFDYAQQVYKHDHDYVSSRFIT